MSRQLETILDECLELIRRGEADVDSCVARYPSYASELRPLLETAVRLSHARKPEPSAEAMTRGRMKLMNALDKRREAARKRSFVRRMFSGVFNPVNARVALPVASVLASFMVVVAVHASTDTVPGDALYPVKIATENVQLALARSDVQKADMNLQIAEQRLQEAAKVGERGDTQQVAALTKQATQHLQEVDAIAKKDKSDRVVASLRPKLESSAVTQLGELQEAMQNAPTGMKPALGQALQDSSHQYASSIEANSSAAPTPIAAVPAAKGTLQIVAMDPPPPGVDQVLVQVSSIEANRAGSGNDKWVNLLDSPATFDLVKVSTIQKILASVQVDAGTYTQLRIQISRATLVIGNSQFDMQVPGDKITMVRPFQVSADQSTTVTMDFNGSQSVKIAGRGKYILEPVITLLVNREAQSSSQDKDKGKETKPAATPRSVEVDGVIVIGAKGQILISGRVVIVNKDTHVDGTIKNGSTATVQATTQPDGTLLATKINVTAPPQSSETPTPATPQARQTPTPQETSEIQGTIENADQTQITISGKRILLVERTQVDGMIAIGRYAIVEALKLPDDSLVATQVTVQDSNQGRGGQDQGGRHPPVLTPAAHPTPSPTLQPVQTPGGGRRP